MNEERGREEPVLEIESVEMVVVEMVDIEEFAKRGEKPPHARLYKFRVDDHYYTTQKAELTGREILAFAGKTPDGYHLRERLRHGKVETVEPDEVEDLREHGVERFITIPRENTDGGGNLVAGAAIPASQRTFSLPETDEEFLDANYPGWETILDGATPWLILNDFPVPEGYDHRNVQAAIEIPSGHPNAPLNMVYFLPGISRTNGRQIPNLAPQTIQGQSWQRWSRHYPWRTGVDDLVTHIERIKSWLVDELRR